ncbi:hypothetical protein F443_04150, partial [Phytophthora nicotianae P1569]
DGSPELPSLFVCTRTQSKLAHHKRNERLIRVCVASENVNTMVFTFAICSLSCHPVLIPIQPGFQGRYYLTYLCYAWHSIVCNNVLPYGICKSQSRLGIPRDLV